MAKLSDQDKSFIKLVLRSPDIGDGWREVSKSLWKFTEPPLFNHTDLLERVAHPEGGGKIKFTPEAITVVKYLV